MNELPRPPSSTSPSLQTVPVWDGATRIFHWTLVLLLLTAYVTRNFLTDPTLYLHRLNGYAILTLVLFRVLWGLFGSSTSRFTSFFPSPGRVWRYTRAALGGSRLHYLGHNPVGSLLILVMLLAVATQGVTGLFATDDAIASGPLYDRAPEWLSARAGSYHARGFWIIWALAALHIVANLTYQFVLKDRLITAMVTGHKPAAAYADYPRADLAPASRAVALLVLSGCIVAGGVMLSGGSLLK